MFIQYGKARNKVSVVDTKLVSKFHLHWQELHQFRYHPSADRQLYKQRKHVGMVSVEVSQSNKLVPNIGIEIARLWILPHNLHAFILPLRYHMMLVNVTGICDCLARGLP